MENSVDVLKFETVRLDPLSRILFIGDHGVVLRNREFALLRYFMDNIGKVLSRDRLLEAVWDRNFCCSTNTVDVHVSGLRKKFRIYAKTDFIKTIHCVGYMFGNLNLKY